MDVVETARDLQRLADRERACGRRIALVPTMGALHAGHLSLVREARQRADRVWVSIFVNPTQFGEALDFESYPSTLERDLCACRDAGVDAVYTPSVDDLYPEGAQTWIDVEKLARPLCGESRPGHFRGVATVVTKLLGAAKPHVIVFGEKDFQQLALIRRLARDLVVDVEVVGAPTVREADGLALSSRNVRLTSEARAQAAALARALEAAEQMVMTGETDSERILDGARRELEAAPLATIDYAELRDPETLDPAPAALEGPILLALAVRFPACDGAEEGVRLIDNRVLMRSPSRAATEDRP